MFVYPLKFKYKMSNGGVLILSLVMVSVQWFHITITRFYILGLCHTLQKLQGYRHIPFVEDDFARYDSAHLIYTLREGSLRALPHMTHRWSELGISLQWIMLSLDESLVPIIFSFWTILKTTFFQWPFGPRRT